MTCLTQSQVDQLVENLNNMCGCVSCHSATDTFSDSLYTDNTAVDFDSSDNNDFFLIL
jgi:N-dimethylarginine dimethylaminohydrolase